MTVESRVVKVGGSLLTWDNLATRLDQWLSEQQTATTILMAGGGPWVELLRHASRRYALDEPSAHWMCVQAMSVTASVLAKVCDCRIVRTYAELQLEAKSSARIVFDVQAWLRSHSSAQDLPKTWDVTSDSIAARLAASLSVSELVLLKSSEPMIGNLQSLADRQYVDRYFPKAAANIPKIRYECLR